MLNVVFVAKMLTWLEWRTFPDWRLWANLPMTGSPFDPALGSGGYRYSPVAVWLIHPLAVWVGPLGFALAHVAVLLALPRKVAIVVGLSFPFWMDLLWGNVFAFVFVAAFWAMRGNRIGTVAFIALTLLMPRPVQFPLLAWLLWKEPWVRLPFGAVFLAHAALVLLSGLGGAWLGVLLGASGNEAQMAYNFGPTRFLGFGWFVVGIPLGLYLFHRYPAWAGLAISPYLLGQYWLMAALGWAGRQQSQPPPDHRTIAMLAPELVPPV